MITNLRVKNVYPLQSYCLSSVLHILIAYLHEMLVTSQNSDLALQ